MKFRIQNICALGGIKIEVFELFLFSLAFSDRISTCFYNIVARNASRKGAKKEEHVAEKLEDV